MTPDPFPSAALVYRRSRTLYVCMCVVVALVSVCCCILEFHGRGPVCDRFILSTGVFSDESREKIISLSPKPCEDSSAEIDMHVI